MRRPQVTRITTEANARCRVCEWFEYREATLEYDEIVGLRVAFRDHAERFKHKVDYHEHATFVTTPPMAKPPPSEPIAIRAKQWLGSER
jgi:hypothetical protein